MSSTLFHLTLFLLISFLEPAKLFALTQESASPFSRGLPPAEKELFLLRPSEVPDFLDDGDWADLKHAIQQSLQYYRLLPKNESLPLGKGRVKVSDLAASLEKFLEFLEEEPSKEELARWVRREFQVVRSGGAKNQGRPKPTVLFTAYHEYFLSAKLSPDQEYRYPLYAKPPDLIEFRKKNGERIVRRKKGKKLVRYYTRKEIDSKKVLKGRGLEIAWAKSPLDILFLQIQGSGWILVPGSNEKYHIRYAADNGHPYRSVGRHLIESGAIPKEKFSREKMIEYLEGLPEKKRQQVLNHNPRYIFFEVVSATHPTRGSLRVPLTAGRSIATDHKIFPKGALAFIETELPVEGSDGNWRTKPLTRFVLNQDEGGAIQGPGRVDFFIGGGEDAAKTAQRMWSPGELYFLLKK